MSVDICYSKMRLVLHKLHIFYAFYADDTIIDRRIFAYIYIFYLTYLLTKKKHS